ncbi:unnamed protein product [Prorocentrum cordatum]|uniref:Methyltransferase domain-containing protein n=1 Tax=Prorocentrum cordatum TaxID=2364126 RepID=A0ABN9RE44_9DINO|nr:unnamed protein product [Polarella glacialis]
MHGKWTSERRRVWAQVLCKGGAAARLSLDGPGMSDELSAPIRLWRGHSGVPVPPEALPQAPRSRWTPGRLRQLMQTIPAAALYPELVSRACDVLERWYERFSLKVWSRFVHFADSGVGRSHQLPKVVKEFNEVAPVLHRLMDWVARSAEAGEPPVAVVDLCSGFGFLSMFASELLPPSAVERIYLVDAAWPNQGLPKGTKHAPGTQSVDHIYGNGAWPIPLVTLSIDVKKGSDMRGLARHVIRDPWPTIICGIHLCGTLSSRSKTWHTHKRSELFKS